MPPNSARQKAKAADDSWKQWPRSADVRQWMHALLRLTDHMDGPQELVSSVVTVAIHELARMGFPDEALEQVEHIHRLLPSDAASEQSWILTTGAEIAFDSADLERMEGYLQRALELQPLFKRKCDRGCQERKVHDFRVQRGLLAPRDAADEKERIEASFNALIRSASLALQQGDRATSIRKLVEAEGLLASMPAWRKQPATEAILVTLSKSGDEEHVQRLLDLDASADRNTRVSARALLKIGQRARAIARFEDEAREALDELMTETLNAHFPAMQLEHAIRSLADADEIDRAKMWLSRALEEGRAWHLIAPGAFSSAVFQSMAKAVARVEGREAAIALVRLAVERADADRKSDWRTAAIRANAELLIELSPPTEAAKLVGKIRSRKSKSRLQAKVFAEREDWDGLHAVLNACAKPSNAAELIWSTKFVWRPAM